MFSHYFKITWRNFFKNKGQSLISVLGLSIAFTCIVLSATWIRHEMTYDTSHPDAKNIFQLICSLDDYPDFNSHYTPTPLAGEMRNTFQELQAVTAVHYIEEDDMRTSHYESLQYNNTSIGSYCNIDEGFFDVFSVQFIIGDKKTALADNNSVVLAESKAKEIFGSAGLAMGARLELKSPQTGEFFREYKVTGVVKDFEHSVLQFKALKKFVHDGKENFLSLDDWCNLSDNRTYIRLINNINKTEFSNKLYNSNIGNCPPGNFKYSILPIHQVPYKHSFNQVLPFTYLLILFSVSFLLFICALFNHLSLFISLMINRLRNLGLRKAIGAGNKQIFCLLLFEFILTILFSFFIGISLMEMLRPNMENFAKITINTGLFYSVVLLFAAIGIIISVTSVWIPIRHVCKTVTKNGMTGKKTTGRQFVQKALIVIQLIISIFFLFISYAMYRQLHYMHNKDLGFNHKNVLIVHPRMENIQEFINNVDRISDELLFNNTITNVAKHTYNFFSEHGGIRTSIHWPEQERERDYNTMISIILADYSFLELFKIPVIQGRNFSKDYADDSKKVLVNDKLSKMMGGNPIGQNIVFYLDDYYEVIGVFGDFHTQSFKSEEYPIVIQLDQLKEPQFLYVRVTPDKDAEYLEHIGRVFKKYGIQDFEIEWMEDIYSSFTKKESLMMNFIGVVSAICLIISIFGIYSLTSYSMQRRRREIAIRKVMGANPSGIIRMFFKEYLWLVIIACIIAIPPAYYIIVEKWLVNYAHRITIEWWSIALIIILISFVVIITIIRQIMKAANSNPAEVIKYE